MATPSLSIPASTPTRPSRRSVSTRSEQRALRALRRRFATDHDLFSSEEMARLRFLRWLYQSGQLVA